MASSRSETVLCCSGLKSRRIESVAKIANRMMAAIIIACTSQDFDLRVNFMFITCYVPYSCYFPDADSFNITLYRVSRNQKQDARRASCSSEPELVLSNI